MFTVMDHQHQAWSVELLFPPTGNVKVIPQRPSLSLSHHSAHHSPIYCNRLCFCPRLYLLSHSGHIWQISPSSTKKNQNRPNGRPATHQLPNLACQIFPSGLQNMNDFRKWVHLVLLAGELLFVLRLTVWAYPPLVPPYWHAQVYIGGSLKPGVSQADAKGCALGLDERC